MNSLNTYDDEMTPRKPLKKLTGNKRLASERAATVVIHNLLVSQAGATSIVWSCTI